MILSLIGTALRKAFGSKEAKAAAKWSDAFEGVPPGQEEFPSGQSEPEPEQDSLKKKMQGVPFRFLSLPGRIVNKWAGTNFNVGPKVNPNANL